MILLEEQSFDLHQENELLWCRLRGVRSYEAAFELKGAVVLPALEVVLASNLEFLYNLGNLSASALDDHKICKYPVVHD